MSRYGGEKSAKEAPITHAVEDLFFAQQMVTNACATQALINSALPFRLMSSVLCAQCHATFHTHKARACDALPQGTGVL